MSMVGYKNINVHNRWGIIVTSGLMAITLIVSWILWLIFYRTNIDEVISVLNEVFDNQDISFTLTFQNVTIMILVLAVATLLLITIPFIFFHKQGIITLFLTLITLVVVIALLVGSGLLIGYGYQEFYHYISDKDVISILFFALPWVLVLFFCLCLVIFCLWLLVAKISNKGDKLTSAVDTNISPLVENFSINSEQNSDLFDKNSTPSVFTEQLPNETNRILEQKPQGINIVITNNSGPLPSKLNEIGENNLVAATTKQVENTNAHNNITNNINGEIVWTLPQIEAVWSKGEIIRDYNPQLYRKDYAGALMFRNSFRNNVTLNEDIKSYSWTIVHQRPLSHGGSFDISNLQPMNNANAIAKGNNYPRWKTAITFNGKQNVLKRKCWKRDKKE